MHKLINLTPHVIHIEAKRTHITPSGTVTIQPQPIPARVTAVEVNAGELFTLSDDGREVRIPIIQQDLGEVSDLPDKRDGVIYIVSRMVAQALPNRPDLMVPARILRDDEGRIIGCEGLEIIHS